MTMTIAPCFPPEVEAEIPEKLPALLPDRGPLAPEGAELLKRTRSICPTCMRVIDADVAAEPEGAVLYKRCAEHGSVRTVVTPDLEFYRTTMNRPPIRRMPFRVLVIPVTHRCNLNCALCFVPKRDRDDLTTDGIKRIIDSFPGPVIGLSGGEPTLRDDLFDLIRYVRSTGRRVQLFTNAIKLTDPAYVDQLMEAGLQHILFSFNGFDDSTYQTINRMPLLDTKRKALENCVKAGLDIVLSPTIFRDLNEAEIKPLINMCLDNAPCVRELRIRGACRVGKHGVFSPLSTGELFKLVADALDRPVSAFLKELDREKALHSIIQFNLHAAFRSGPSGYKFAAWNSGIYLQNMTWDQVTADLEHKAREAAGGFLPHGLYQQKYKTLEINTWGWPDAANIDFQEINSHGVLHLYDNRVPMNFCEAVLRADAL